MTIERRSFGTARDGTEVALYELSNAAGVQVELIELGASVRSLRVPGRDGRAVDVVLGFDDVAGYLENPAYFGCTVGRCANRIGGARFTLDGETYELAANDGANHLHGGVEGFHRKLWKGDAFEDGDGAGVRFRRTSPDGEEGYPGTLRAAVTFALSAASELRLDYEATGDAPTPVNLTNHSYFNLAGADAGSILEHVLELRAERYTVADATRIPTGELRSVEGTPLDFRTAEIVGARIGELPGDPAAGDPGGYDHNFVLGAGGALDFAARVEDPTSGRVMEVLTTEPGVQFYTGNFLDGSVRGKGGAPHAKHAALCLETQHFPDSVNRPEFPSVILRPGTTYRSTTVYRFPVR